MTAPLLEISGLTHRFGGLQAVSDFSFHVGEGELLGLIGPNGAGKTTIFNLVSGFYRPTQGDIRFGGRTIAGRRPHAVTSLGIARTFQNIRLWNRMTVLENLCISQHHRLGYGLLGAIVRGPGYRMKEEKIYSTAMEMLRVLGLERYAAEYPGNLPYGMQRRVEIARALATGPRLLLLDEPAAGMNPAEVERLIDLIRWIREKFSLAIWLIEHQMSVVMALCERICVVDFGQAIAVGPPEEIRADPRVIRAYLGDEGVRDAEN